jgi:selenocysteine lyase/cysteine desulfurase
MLLCGVGIFGLDIDKLRSEFPVTRKYAYFDHAAVGPLPTRAVNAAERVMEEKCEGDLHWQSWEETVEGTRNLVAGLIGASAEEIALVHSTTEGLAIVANGLSYEKGSNIVTCDMEFQSNLFPWQAIARRQGLELKVVRNRAGRLRMEDFSDAIDADTRLVAVSYVQYSNGFRIDLEELSKIAHENDAYVVTDAVQAVGQMPVDVSKLGVDFLATSGYKWLLSPIATGFLYVRRDLFDQLWPTIVGYRSDEQLWDFGFREFRPAPNARRYESGQLNFPGFTGMRESVELLKTSGDDIVWRKILSLLDRLLDGIKGNASVQVRSSLDGVSRSGILNLACKDPDSVAKRLLEHGVAVSVRSGGLRISPHFYNTENEIDKLVSELSSL